MLQQKMLDQKEAQAAETATRYSELLARMDRMLAKQDESAVEVAELRSLLQTAIEKRKKAELEARKMKKLLENACNPWLHAEGAVQWNEPEVEKEGKEWNRY